jgi:hypothetical protein
MNEMNMIEMDQVTGGGFWGELAGSAAAGGLGAGVGAAASATTVAALAGPIALGLLVGGTAYLVRAAINEAVLTAETLKKHGI